MSRRFDVFVSHSSKDKPWVHRLVADLGRYGVSVWLDENEIRPGDLFAKALEQGIAQSRAVALVVSPEAMGSGWIEEEYYRALSLAQRKNERLQLIPVLLRTAELPGFLENRQHIDFRDERQYAQSVWRLAWGITGEKPATVLELDANALPPLPRDRMPDPAPLPPGSRMPMARNPLFVGREDELRELAEALQVGSTAAISQVASVTGLGGMGKTQLAAELVHRYGQFFPGGVFWLSFSDPAAVAAEIALCGGPGHLGLWSAEATPDLATQLAMVRAAWNRPVPRLLVFDNCEDEKLLAEWRPVTGGCRVLVTCRRSMFSPHLGVHALALDVLPRAESIALLRSLERGQPLNPADDAALDEICAELGDLPLALHLAGSFLARYRNTVTPAAYLDQLRDRALLGHPSLQGRGAGDSPTRHDLHVRRTFALSWKRLPWQGAVFAKARDLLRRAACLAPGEPIPRTLLVATLTPAGDDADTALTREDALHRLVELGLLDAPEPGAYRIHRLVAAFARQTAGDHAAVRSVVEQVLLREAERVNASGFPTRLLSWQPHLRAVTDAARAREDEQAASLCQVLGRHLFEMGDYRGARPYCEHALAIRERLLGPEHPDVATSLDSLAELLQAQGAHAEAQPLFERALAIREQQLGPEHPLTGSTLVHLGRLLKNDARFASARPLLERALAIAQQLETDPLLEAEGRREIAYVHRAEGSIAEARRLFELALSTREQWLGPEHPRTARSLTGLALILQDEGALAKARPLLERALAICERQLGPEHPHTAQSLNDLALLLQEQGAHAEARPLYERALAICERWLGPDHPQTATTLNNLATLLHAQGAHAEARPLYERALAIFTRQLKASHPQTATTLSNLAALLHLQGAHDEARPLYKRALAIRVAALGKYHPSTIRVRENLRRLPES